MSVKPTIFEHVPPQWPLLKPCPIAFVGEAPSDVETTLGQPLVGPAGAVFNQALALAGLRREDHFITNLFDEQAPDNDPLKWCGGTKESKGWIGYDLPQFDRGKWLRPEYAWHLTRLGEELALARPKVIVAMGKAALWAFAGHAASIKTWRGTAFEARMVAPGVKCIATIHPAAILHSDYKLLPIIAMDFAKAAREAHAGPEIRYTPRELLIEPTIEAVEAFATETEKFAEVVGLDLETIPLFRQIKCIAVALGPARLMTIPFVDYR